MKLLPRLLPLSVALSCLCSMPSQAGAMAFAEVEIDWGSISFNLPEYSFVERRTLSEADATYWSSPEATGTHSPMVPTSVSNSGWDPTSYAAGVGGGFGSSIANDSMLEAQGSASAAVDETASEGSAHTVREALFLFAETGSAEISFNYLLNVSLSASEKGDYAMGIASFDAAFLLIQPEDQSGGGVRATTIIKSVFGPGSFSDSKSGTITFSEQVMAGEQWGFAIDAIAYARAENRINEPGSLLLLLLGFLLMAGWKGRV